MNPTWTTAPAASTSRTSATVSSTSAESGFSQKHGIPRPTAARTSPAWAGVAAAITTASGSTAKGSPAGAARAEMRSASACARPGSTSAT